MLPHALPAGASGIGQRLCPSNLGLPQGQGRSGASASRLGACAPRCSVAASKREAEDASSSSGGAGGNHAVPLPRGAGGGAQRRRPLLVPHSKRLTFRSFPVPRAAQGAHGPEEPSANTPPAHQDTSAASPPAAASGAGSGSAPAPGPGGVLVGGPAAVGGGVEAAVVGEFCIIEGPDTLQDFARMQLEEIRDNIDSRRNRIFLLMEEIRRLRIQQRLRRREQKARATASALAASALTGAVEEEEEEEELPEYPSFIPFLPPLTSSTLKEYYATFAGLVFSIIVFGAIVAPTLEVRLGLGGTSYADFIRSVGLPMQLSEVDPIVASFSGGAVGVLSALLVVETNNVKQQEHKKCMYCYGSGYLTCARCSGTGAVMSSDAVGSSAGEMRCPNCAGSSKVMCPTCLCTGRALATEHDPRIDPFD